MLKHFLKVTVRTLYKQKQFAAFNLLGIAMGIACCIVVYLFVQHLYAQDSFHTNGPAIFMVNHVRTTNGHPERWAPTPAPLGPALGAELADVKRFVRLHSVGAVVKYGDGVFHESVRLADPAFFQLFTFPLQEGNANPLNDPSDIVLSSESARKYFGTGQAVGQSLTLLFDGNLRRSFTVKAVAAPFPQTASFSFDMLVNYVVGKDLGWREDDWRRQVDATFIQLNTPTAVPRVSQALTKYVKRHHASNPQVPITAFYLDNLREVSRNAYQTRRSLAVGTSPTAVVVLSVLASLVLLMACFNFMNYTIATSTTRFKEIGVRKVLGSTRPQLIQQFIGENLLMGILALGLGLLLVDTLFLPTFSRLIDFYQLRFHLVDNWPLLVFLLALVIGISLASGLYPSLYISAFNPVHVLKGQQRIGGTNGLVRTLLVLEFGLSLFTVAAALVTTQNAQFMRHMDVGYDQTGLLVLRTNSEQSFAQLRQAAAKLPGVVKVAGSQDQLGSSGDNTATLEHETTRLAAEVLRVSSDYVSLLGLRLVQGRPFLSDSPADADHAILVNQTLVKAMGWQTAVGKRVRLNDRTYEVVGVIKDFNYRSFFLKIAPCVMKLNVPSDNRVLTMKIHTKEVARLSEALKAEWQRAVPNVPFQVSEQTDVYADSHDESRRVKDVFTYVAILTLIISAMGLFALVSLNIAKRTKEIGIRKVLGASAYTIAQLVSREFVILITLAGGFFLPIAFVVLKALLESEYAYSIPVTVLPFACTLVVMLLLALATISAQVYQIATANPVKSLRTE